MTTISAGNTELLAGILAQRLLDVYQSEQVPAMVEEFASVGFTRGSLILDRDALYRFVINAAYDRQPFTMATGGYEYIWEMRGKGNGVPSLISSVDLWSIDDARNTPEHETKRKLSQLYLGRLPMDKYGITWFDKTFYDTSHRITPEFHKQIMLADSSNAIKNVFSYFTHIHGIAKTIASKLVKYLLREIAIGRAKPSDFPLDVVLPIKGEYHVKEAGDKLQVLSRGLVQRTAEILLQRGDAFAIDGLFYMQRTKSSEFDNLINELANHRNLESKSRINLSDREESKAMSYAKHHDELAAAMSIHRGKTLTAKDVRTIFKDQYPHLDVAWVQPSDHCIDHTCKGACICAETEKAIFSRPKRNTYVVL